MTDHSAIGRYVALLIIMMLLFYMAGKVKKIHGLMVQHSIERELRLDREVGPMMNSNLPRRCAVYYDNGTDDWVDCMGVGYVK